MIKEKKDTYINSTIIAFILRTARMKRVRNIFIRLMLHGSRVNESPEGRPCKSG